MPAEMAEGHWGLLHTSTIQSSCIAVPDRRAGPAPTNNGTEALQNVTT